MVIGDISHHIDSGGIKKQKINSLTFSRQENYIDLTAKLVPTFVVRRALSVKGNGSPRLLISVF
jgi:hypothetical protein